MYNRYIPDANGVYHQTLIDAPKPAGPPPSPPPAPPCADAPAPAAQGKENWLQRLLPRQIDTGDLLVLLILLLLLVDCDEQDSTGLILTAAAFLLL